MMETRRTVSRREALLAGAGVLGTAAALSTPGLPAMAATAESEDSAHTNFLPASMLPQKQIEGILHTMGKVSKDVFSLMLFRTDLHLIGPDNRRWSPYFQSMHEFYFQAIGKNRCIMNCDITFKDSEVERALDAILRNGFSVQAMHQHFVGEKPQTFHYHFRKIGHPIQIAHEIVSVIRSTSTPFPQSSSSNPKSPLPANQMAKILGGGTPDIREDGVVDISVDRRNKMVLDGVTISPELNISSGITFQPLNSAGTLAIAGPDIGMTGREIERTLRRARSLGFAVHCLYNQETREDPQLYFSHMLKHGNPLQLSREIRMILDETNVEGSPRR